MVLKQRDVFVVIDDDQIAAPVAVEITRRASTPYMTNAKKRSDVHADVVERDVSNRAAIPEHLRRHSIRNRRFRVVVDVAAGHEKIEPAVVVGVQELRPPTQL